MSVLTSSPASMRVTRETRQRTRARLLQAGRELFAERGLGGTPTRELAARAGIAVGTLFNYFPTKEALALELLGQAAEEAAGEFAAARRDGAPLEETLFGHVAVELRHLAPFRRWAGAALQAVGGPLRRGRDEAQDLRVGHLERVEGWLSEAGDRSERGVTLHLYWSLYLGVLDFWSRDETEHQGATLALLDRAMGLFCGGLHEAAGEANDGRATTDAG